MEKTKVGDDAADHAPRPDGIEKPKSDQMSRKQDAPNYADREDDGRSIPIDDVSSANDE